MSVFVLRVATNSAWLTPPSTHCSTKHARNLFVDVPTDKPHGYNTTQHPVTVDYYMQTTCPLTVRVRNSFPRTAANIAHQFGHWLPAHLVAALFLGLKHQLSVTPKNEPFKCAPPAYSLRKSASFFIITASRVFVKMIQWTGVMPPLDDYEHSMVVSVLVHGAAVALVVLLIGAIGGVVGCGGGLLHRIGRRFGRSPMLRSGWPEVVVGLMVKMPAALGTVLLGIVMSTCGGLALVLACVLHLMIVSVVPHMVYGVVDNTFFLVVSLWTCTRNTWSKLRPPNLQM